MAVWTVWEHDKFEPDTRKAERAIFVRDGFSWWASLFGPLWLLRHGMIVVLIGYLVIMGAANFAAAEQLGEVATFYVSAVLTLWFGFEARALRRWALARRGWRMMDVVEARRRVDAERRYYAERLASEAAGAPGPRVAPVTPQPWGAVHSQPVLGLFPEHPR